MFYSGNDLGQAADFTTLVVTEQIPLAAPLPRRRYRYDVRHIQVWDLGTDYTVIADDIAALFQRKPLTYSRLAVDFTGVGRPVFDQLRAAKVQAHMTPILITGGAKVTEDADDRSLHVPKRDLVGTLVALMQSDLVKVAEKIPHLARLKKELGDFKTKISRKSASEQFGAWSDGQHDDIVLALMMAVWLGEHMGGGTPRDIKIPEGRDASATESMPDGVFHLQGR
jgi:hypothetical protein